WQMLAKRKGAILDYIEIEDGARIDMSDYKERLEKEPKIVSFTHASNVLGTINDAKKMTQMAHSAGAAVLVDGAQSAPHLPINLKDIGCDFFVLSGHKMLAPSGIGALIAKEDTLEKMEPV
ncbi:MAG: aminotransferase class V-fold PLP-dependent enzyme, partial [Candidatus Micrarchaeota archaeon]|nr:aminotransferase class V-fold PLP-dependent enzyme [Candidatus Micrarchaeota archaeon]